MVEGRSGSLGDDVEDLPNEADAVAGESTALAPEPGATEAASPDVTEPAEPDTSEPGEPDLAEPAAAEVTEPVVPEPAASEVTEPDVPEPASEVTEPDVPEPAAAEVTEPAVREPAEASGDGAEPEPEAPGSDAEPDEHADGSPEPQDQAAESDEQTDAAGEVDGSSDAGQDDTAIEPLVAVPDAVEPAVGADVEPAAAADGPDATAAELDQPADVEQVAPVQDETAHWPATADVTDPTADGRIDAGPVPVAQREPSLLDDFAPDDRRRRWPRALAVVAGVVVLLGGLYVGAAFALADRVPAQTSVAGVQIGGLSAKAATAALSSALADRTSRTIPVAAKDQQSTVDPAAAGLAFDPAATVAQVTGVDLAQPARLWHQVVGGGVVRPVTSVDRAKLSTAVAALADSLHADPVDGAIVFVDGVPRATAAADGWQLDQAAATSALADRWLTTSGALALPTTVVAPTVSQAATDEAMSTSAIALSRGSVTVAVGGATAVLPVSTLTAAASFTAGKDGALTLTLDGKALVDAVVAQLPTLLTTSADARFDLSSGSPVIVPGVPGTTIDPKALAAAVLTASTSTARTANVQLVASDPSASTADLESLGVKEVVAEFDTPLTSEPRRTVNIANGAAKITGTLIRPGETFSLAAALGPVDAAHGYTTAGAIVDGQHTDAWGGGLSQVSTTTYNAAFFAGYELVEHKPHSEYFTRYPAGREATIFAPQLDMKWKNNTPYGALVQGWVAGGRVYVQIWSTKYWTVQTTTSPRRGVVAPTTVYETTPGCTPSGAGNPGFSVTVTRTTLLDGTVKNNESWNWTYKPQNRVVCSAPPAG